jgi:hypothetical protein
MAVRDQQVVVGIGQRSQRLLAVLNQRMCVTETYQLPRNDGAIDRVVLGNQDARVMMR